MEDKRVSKILKKFHKARNRRQNTKDAIWKELDAFDRNQQWSLQNVPPWLPRPVTNFVHLVKYTKRAALAIENPTGKLRPIGPEDVAAIAELQQIYEFSWDKLNIRKVVRENIETAKLLGTAITQVYWDESKEGKRGTTVQGSKGALYEGDICARQIDPACFFPDPSAFSIQDCQFIHVVERKPIEWIKKHFNVPNLESKEDNPQERGEIYHRDYTTETDGLIDFHSHYEKIANSEGGFDYKVTYIAGNKIVKEIPKLQPNRYPFAILYDFPQRQDFWGMSTCEFILDNQKIINKVESIITMIGTLMQNPQKVVSRSSGINPKEASKFGMAPGHTFVSNDDPSRSIIWKEPPNIPPALFNLLENAKQNIREVTGLTEAYMGQTVGSLQTSSGVDSLIERATLRDRDQMYDVELYIHDLSVLLLDFIVTYYSEERYMRIVGEKDGEYEFTRFVGTDYKDLDYDLHVDVSAKAPISRMREEREAMELLQMQGQYQFPVPVITPQEFMQQKDYVNKDQLLKRMDMDEMRNKTEEAMQVAQMMAEALASGIPPEEVYNMGTTMLQQMEQAPPGQPTNMNQVQMAQSTPMPVGQ